MVLYTDEAAILDNAELVSTEFTKSEDTEEELIVGTYQYEQVISATKNARTGEVTENVVVDVFQFITPKAQYTVSQEHYDQTGSVKFKITLTCTDSTYNGTSYRKLDSVTWTYNLMSTDIWLDSGTLRVVNQGFKTDPNQQPLFLNLLQVMVQHTIIIGKE